MKGVFIKRLSFNKTYYVANKDLGLDDGVPGHEVIIVKISKDRTKVKVKTITSIERPNKEGEKRKFKNTKRDLVSDLHSGLIIVVPHKYLNTPKLSGVYTKGIWIKIDKLKPNKYGTKLSKKYREIIGK